MINRIIEYSLENRAVVIIATLMLAGLGWRYASMLPIDVYPNLNAPVVSVVTENPGMAPEDIETLITFPLESSLNSLPYVTRVRSNSALGISIISVEFEYGTDIYFARQLVSEKLQLIAPTLPDGSVAPFIGPVSSMFADAIEFTIEGDDLYDIRDFAEWNLRPRLQTVPGVSNVINFGGLLKQYHVLLDPNRMLQYDVAVRDVVRALGENNLNSSGGYLLDGPEEKIIRGMGRISSIPDIENIVLLEREGVPVLVKHVADVEVGPFLRRGSAGVNEREIVAVTVQNQYNSNVLRTIRGVERVLDDVRESLGSSMTIETFYTQLDMIMKSFRNILRSMIFGAVLVVLILYLFMNNVRSALVVSLAIPLSGVAAVIFMRLYGLTVNIMTMGGLAVGLGMIVDSSIIMAENIHRHIAEDDLPFADALRAGAREVGRPIFYSVLILLAVFAPIFTLQGIEGRMFIPLAFAVSAAVFGSLVVSLTIIPVAASLLYGRRVKKPGASIAVRLLGGAYRPLLDHTLSHPWRMAATCIVIMAVGLGLFFRTGTEFMPEMDESSLIMDILLPPETSLDESSRIASLLSRRVAEIPEVVKVVRRTGRAEGAEHAEPVNLTEANVVLVPREDRDTSIEEIKEKIRDATAGVPGVSVLLNPPLQHRINHVMTGTKTAVAVKVFGENLATATELADRIHDIIADINGVADLQKEQIAGVPQLQIRIDRARIARYGLNVADISDIIETALNGRVATELIETQKRYDIFVRYKERFRADEAAIRNILVETPSGFKVPLGELASFVEDSNPSIIRRENALRRVMVQCNVSGRDMGSVVEDIRAAIADVRMPDGYFVTFGGTYESQMRAMRQLTLAVILTVVIVFSLLVVSFHSFRHALLIVINIPLALVGGVIILNITGGTLSVPSIVGFIALTGIAVQDGIVLLSHINGYRSDGLPVRDSVMKAGLNKLRPVLMTTFTTMLGLVPLALGNATGSEIQKPLAFVIMFGLLFSTAVTLLVLPTLYLAVERGKSEG